MDDKVGGTCGTHELFTGFWLGGPKARDYWEDLGVSSKITLRWTLMEIGMDGTNWIRLAQNKIQWWACVNTVTNLRFP